jgi:excisionase family DNA binding protein
MNIETDYTILIDAIVEKVVERLKPFLSDSNKTKDDELMDVQGLADYLKVKTSWIYEKVHTKQIPFQKAGRFPRFRKKNIDKWLENPYSFLNVPIGRSEGRSKCNE